MTSAFSWQNSISRWPASFCTPRPKCSLPQVSLDFLLLPSSPLWWIAHLFWRSSQNHSTSASTAYWSGHRFALPWYWMVCLGNKQRLFCHFWDCAQVLHFRLFCWLWCYSISSKGFLPTVVDIMVISVKFTHFSPPVHQFTDSSLTIFPFSSFWLSQDSWVS